MLCFTSIRQTAGLGLFSWYLHLGGALEYLPRGQGLRGDVSLDRAILTIHHTADVANRFRLLGQFWFIQISYLDHCIDIDSRAMFRLSSIEGHTCLMSLSQAQEEAIVAPIMG